MAYKVTPYLVFGIPIQFWKSYQIDDSQYLHSKGWFQSTKRISLDDASIEVDYGRFPFSWSRKFFDIGNIRVTAQNGQQIGCNRISSISRFEKAVRGELPVTAKAVNFGESAEEQIVPSNEAVKIRTPSGTFVNNQDGTVSHIEANLMFMGAPVGTRFEGGLFFGSPATFGWRSASKLFGRGKNAPSPTGGISGEKLESCAFSNGYKSGISKVRFCGYSDWRLPTANELDLLAMSHRRGKNWDKTNSVCDEFATGWDYSISENANAAFELMFPYYKRTGSRFMSWSANADGVTLAWLADGQWPLGDYRVHQEFPVLLVRNA
ncbi:MAG: hypothetical protein ACF8K1_04690 [Phycisphaerales bacterium JB047]